MCSEGFHASTDVRGVFDMVLEFGIAIRSVSLDVSLGRFAWHVRGIVHFGVVNCACCVAGVGKCAIGGVKNTFSNYFMCRIVSCHVMSCHVMSCHVMSCHVLSWSLTRVFDKSPVTLVAELGCAAGVRLPGGHLDAAHISGACHRKRGVRTDTSKHSAFGFAKASHL